MEGKRLCEQLGVSRVSERHRLEEELWVAVYERIFPLVARRVKQGKSALEDEPMAVLAAGAKIARRA